MKNSNALLAVVTVAIVLLTATACDTDTPAASDAPAPAPATAEPAATVPPAPPLPPLRQPHEGIDVSHHSGAVDWKTVRGEGYGFAYVKASEGVDSPDPLFAQHWKDLAASGLARGAYHFYVTEDDPEQQAKLFLDTLATVDHGDDDLLPVVDVEVIGHATPADWATNLERFIEIVENELGVRPMVYTMPNFWDANVGKGYDGAPLWVAEYEVDAPRLPAGFDAWHLWQYEQDRDVPGVEKGADVNRVHPDHGIDHLRIGAVRKAGGVVGGVVSGAAADADDGGDG